MQPIEFSAPWSRALKIGTYVIGLFLIAVTIFGWLLDVDTSIRLTLLIVPIVVLVVSLLYGVRGYTLTETAIEIRRVGWSTRLPLDDLQAVEGKADAMLRAHRVLTNGLFAFVGFYYSGEFGLVFAYATDLSRAVVLRYPRKKIVLTPHDPQQFIIRVRTLLKTSSYPPGQK